MNKTVLVIGAGVAGMEVSLVLAKAGHTVHLVEKSSIIGGQIIKCEEVFPNMECATCMVSPMQQEILQRSEITLHTLAELTDIKRESGAVKARVKKRAGYVDPAACIGCGSCSEACPESVANEFEEGMVDRKAISVPCAGALPNVPYVDTEICRRFKGDECTLCVEACMFAAIDFNQSDEDIDITADAVVIATGFSTGDLSRYMTTGNGPPQGIYSAWEMERLFASNGPTEGAISLRDGRTPKSVAIIHCIDREERGYCSSICCLYSLKFVRYLQSKLESVEMIELHKDLCLPGKRFDQFAKKSLKKNLRLIHHSEVNVTANGNSVDVDWTDRTGKRETAKVDMAILVPPVIPGTHTAELAALCGVQTDEKGFFVSGDTVNAEQKDPSEGVFIAGAALGPMDASQSISSADAVAGMILSRFKEVRSGEDE